MAESEAGKLTLPDEGRMSVHDSSLPGQVKSRKTDHVGLRDMSGRGFWMVAENECVT